MAYLLNGPVGEYVDFAKNTFLTAFFFCIVGVLFCKMNYPQNHAVFYYRVNMGKTNYFEASVLLYVQHRPNCITCCT